MALVRDVRDCRGPESGKPAREIPRQVDLLDPDFDIEEPQVGQVAQARRDLEGVGSIRAPDLGTFHQDGAVRGRAITV